MKKNYSTKYKNKIYYCLLIATILYVGIKVKIGYTSKINVNEDFTGIVTTIVKKENSFKLTIKGKEKLIVYISNIENIELGDKVVVKGKYTLPKKATIPNNFDYQKYLYNKCFWFDSVSWQCGCWVIKYIIEK